MSFPGEVWTTLSAIDCNEHVQKKMNLSYLSWAWAWGTLMKYYPESTYTFDEVNVQQDQTAEVWVTVTVGVEGKGFSRRMWLPVMDHKNNAVVNPTTRHISDTRMRCLTKCLAMFGLGHYIYAGEDIPDKEAVQAARVMDYAQAVKENQASIDCIIGALAENNMSTAAEAWFQLKNEVKAALWKAPRDGGCFTTAEMKTIKSQDFRLAYYPNAMKTEEK